MGGFLVTIEGQEFSVLCIGDRGVHIAEFRKVPSRVGIVGKCRAGQGL
jgi:hypothetical protein